MDIEFVKEKLIQLISSIKGKTVESIGPLPDTEDFISTLSFDSIESVKLTLEIGTVFNIDFGEDIDDVDSLSSIGSLAEQIHRRALA
ncbi:MAG: phosphopantetheine-binding protein [Cellvibrionales bacterium]|nr:phosphopantetheine-binding protein [Cellvibrionales bacterium]